jgi:excinuclease ABC subunit C
MGLRQAAYEGFPAVPLERFQREVNFEFTTGIYNREAFLTEALPALPKGSGVFKIFDTRGQLIVLDKTSNLHDRLQRYFGERSERVKDLDLREITSRIEYYRTWSPFETTYVLYVQRRQYFPKTYRKMRTFRLYNLMKVNRKQRFPRIYASRQIKTGVDYFGPFVTRGQFARLKTALERTFKLRPCLYNIRGGDPHSDCLYFQMHTCSRPCNDDISRENYLADVEAALQFIQGHDEQLEVKVMDEISKLATGEEFEKAELARKRLEKIQRARKEYKDTFPSVWGFDYLVLLPSNGVARTKVAFARAGTIVKFEDYETAALPEVLPRDVVETFAIPEFSPNREWQYDEFCLVANYVVRPLKSVELVKADRTDLAEYLKRKIARKKNEVSDTDDASSSR